MLSCFTWLDLIVKRWVSHSFSFVTTKVELNRISILCGSVYSLLDSGWIQACRQDLAAGGAINQKEGPKTRRGGHIFKIQYWLYAATGGPNVKWGGGHHWHPRRRRPWLNLFSTQSTLLWTAHRQHRITVMQQLSITLFLIAQQWTSDATATNISFSAAALNLLYN